jgi:hypothetical protein
MAHGHRLLVVHLAHRHRSSEVPIGSLVQLRDGQLAVGVPVPVRTSTDDVAVTMIPVVAGHF